MKLNRGDVTLVLLAGGLNERLRRTETSLPKSLMQLHDVPPLMILLAQQFLRHGAKVIVVCDALAAVRLRILYPATAAAVKIVHDDFNGTGPALRLGVEAARSRWVLTANADTIVPVDLVRWYTSIELDSAVHQLLVPRSVQNSGLIGMEPVRRRIAHWGEILGRSPACGLRPASSTGVYLIHRSSWLAWPYSLGASLERDILPEAVHQHSLRGSVMDSTMPVFDYGTFTRLQELQTDDRLRDNLLTAAGLLPKGHPWTSTISISGLRDISADRQCLTPTSVVS